MKSFVTTVSKIETITDTKWLLYLEKPTNFLYKPGQFVTFTLTHPKLGQITRPYSIASLPEERYLLFFISLKPQGVMSNVLQTLKKGDEILIRGPFGTITPDRIGTNFDTLLLIAAGTGIGPIRPLVKYYYFLQNELKLYVFHQVSYIKELVFKEEFKSWATWYVAFASQEKSELLSKHNDIKKGYIFDYWHEISKLYKNNNFKVVTFGPSGFVHKVLTFFEDKNVIKEGW